MSFYGFKIFLLAIAQIFGEMILKMVHSIPKIFRQYPTSYIAIIYLFITMAFCYYPIFEHWIAGFIMMSLPVAILFGLIASCYLFVQKQKMIATVGFIWILLTFPLLKRIVGIGNGEPKFNPVSSLKVLSFNGESFSQNDENDNDLGNLQADIACFQEYSPNPTIEAQYAHNILNLKTFAKNKQIGLALFSKYPILKQYGKVWDRKNQPNINGFLCADIIYNHDTVRVVNVHLWSMGVRINLAMDALKKGHLITFGKEIYDSFRRLKEGFEKRDEQIKEVESYVSGSQYPVIICGDFNETPFGYSYGKLKLSFKNAFEEAGQGMGFTLNRQPYYARIDQQFYSSDWQVQSCKIMSGVNFSDHFPVLANYILKKSYISPAVLVAQR
jgi:endonuclease/exonuclease/phosphatase family metal-dependent hydrolase